MKRRLILLVFITLGFTSCKTQEQIKREQLVDSMSVQMVQNQQLTAEATTQLQNMDERINNFQGILEVNKHEKDTKLEALQERIKVLEEQNQTINQNLEEANKRLEEQDKFIKEILKTLKSSKTRRKTKKSSPYDLAMGNYRKGRYKTARTQLEKLYKSKGIKGYRRARVIHNLGMISFMQKRNDDSITYFSKLFTEFPKSKYNANGLIHLARTFKRMGQKDQAKQTLEEMINRFPKHHRVKIAKKELGKL